MDIRGSLKEKGDSSAGRREYLGFRTGEQINRGKRRNLWDERYPGCVGDGSAFQIFFTSWVPLLFACGIFGTTGQSSGRICFTLLRNRIGQPPGKGALPKQSRNLTRQLPEEIDIQNDWYECFFKSFHTTIAFNGSSIVPLSSSSGPTMDSMRIKAAHIVLLFSWARWGMKPGLLSQFDVDSAGTRVSGVEWNPAETRSTGAGVVSQTFSFSSKCCNSVTHPEEVDRLFPKH
uniref:Uncharacterized protein n=1 Tax=Timema genevievae TaxID=629358 RepID=A0A7R9JRT2_TIMGE|nr:unnamed protein product [Timema genevievae]